MTNVDIRTHQPLRELEGQLDLKFDTARETVRANEG